MQKPFTIRASPKAILHIDGDGFFASIEQAMNPALRGKPVVTGRERGIASAMSIEAKRAGVTRGMRISEIKRACPGVHIVPSDYETYSLFSKRMYEIVRRYTSELEEYSIDECFAELRHSQVRTCERIVQDLKASLERELGVTFSIGLAPTKVLAKIASNWRKPSGLTFLPMSRVAEVLPEVAVEDVWGIGARTMECLNRVGIKTAADIAGKPEWWIAEHLHKPYREIWYELNGTQVYPVVAGEPGDGGRHAPYQSISKTKTFTPPSADRSIVYARLAKNVENACIKLRRHGLSAKQVTVFLKTQAFEKHTVELDLPVATANPNEMLNVIERAFDSAYYPNVLYRATGIITRELVADSARQQDLFNASEASEKLRSVYTKVDEMDRKFGKHTVFLGASMRAFTQANTHDHPGTPAGAEYRRTALNKFRRSTNPEGKRQRLGIPYLGEVM